MPRTDNESSVLVRLEKDVHKMLKYFCDKTGRKIGLTASVFVREALLKIKEVEKKKSY